MFRALELRTLELTLCFHSDTVPQYLDQTIRDAHPVFVSKTVPVYLHRPALVPPLYFIHPKGFPLVFLRWDPTPPCWTDKSFPNRLVLGCVKSTVVSLSFSFFFVTVKSGPSFSRCVISQVLSIVYSEIVLPLVTQPTYCSTHRVDVGNRFPLCEG